MKLKRKQTRVQKIAITNNSWEEKDFVVTIASSQTIYFDVINFDFIFLK